MTRYSLVTPNRADATCLMALAPPVAVGVPLVARRILAALAGVRLAADPVHRNGERFVRLLADRPVRHRAGRKPPDDALDRLDLVDRHRRRRRKVEQAAQRGVPAVLIVDELRVLLEDGVLPAAGGVLQLEHRVGVEQVVLAVAAPLVLAAVVQVGRSHGPHRVRAPVPLEHLLGDDLDADAADARRRPGEIAIDEGAIEADRFEDLRAAIALKGRDAHLGHHLQDAFVERVNVVLDRLLVRDADEQPLLDHVVERLEREVRVDDAGAVAEQQRAVMHLARVAGLDDQPAPRARALADEVMMDAGRREEARNRRAIAVGAAVRQDQDRVAGVDRVAVPAFSGPPGPARGPGRPGAGRTASAA